MESRNGKRMMSAAGRFAYSRFALNFAMFYETMADVEYHVLQKEDVSLPSEKEMARGLKAWEGELLPLVGRFFQGECSEEDVDAFRQRLIHESEKLMTYMDYFSLYEYVLKRLDKRFSEEVPEIWTDREAVDEMMRFIVSAQEAPERNQRIKNILSELPMRFTKAKFFSMIRQAMAVYEGVDRQTLEEALENLKREALLVMPRGMEEGHEQLDLLLKQLKEADYRNPDKESWKKLREVFNEAKETLFYQSTDRLNLMEMVNDFYVMNLAGADMLMDGQEKKDMDSLVFLLLEKMNQGDYSLPEEELAEFLVPLEGRQEAYYEQWSRFEDANFDGLLGKDAGKEDREKARKVSLLLSTSLYMSLEPEEKPREEGILLSRRAVEAMCQPLCDELEADWKGKPKCVVRAMMANLLSKLPMFFLTSDELRDFLAGCLSSCTDRAEKSASLEEIRKLMEMEDDDDLV